MPSGRRAQQPVVAPPRRSPLFIENVGQLDRSVRFQVEGAGFGLTLTERALRLAVPVRAGAGKARPVDPKRAEGKPRRKRREPARVEMVFPGANRRASLERFGRLRARYSILRGADPKGWWRNVPLWRGARYRRLYPGIDLEVSGEAGRLELRLLARKGADLERFRLRIEGATSVRLVNAAGKPRRPATATHLKVVAGASSLILPLIHCRIRGGEVPRIERHGAGGFEVLSPFVSPEERPGEELVESAVEPRFAIYSADFDTDHFLDIAIDGDRNLYVVGPVDSSYPAGGTTQDAFVAKYNADGLLVYRTVFGGSGYDYGSAIAVDSEGCAYVTGQTYSQDFPVTANAFQARLAGSGYPDAFVVKLAPDGALKYATYLGGPEWEIGRGIAVDDRRWIYVVGSTTSANFPVTADAYQLSLTGWQDVFVTVLEASRGPLVYSTHLGGTGSDYGWGIAIGLDHAICVVGTTSSVDFPTTATAFKRTFSASRGRDPYLEPTPIHAFVSVLRAGETELQYSTFLGGKGPDEGLAIALDEDGTIYVAGAGGHLFPTTPGAFQTVARGGSPPQDAFLAVLDRFASGTASLLYSSLLGGSASDRAWSLTVGRDRNVYLTGVTYSDDFPVSADAFQPRRPGDVFVACFDPRADGPLSRRFCSYYGGSGADFGYGIAVDDTGDAYLAGSATSLDLPYRRNSYGGGLADGYILWLRLLA